MLIAVVLNDKVYKANYDFVKDKWTIEDNETINEWPDNKYTQILEKPEAPCYIYTGNSYFCDVTIYGIDKDYFNAYIKKLITTKGFEDNHDESSDYYNGEDSSGNSIGVSFYETERYMSMTLSLGENE